MLQNFLYFYLILIYHLNNANDCIYIMQLKYYRSEKYFFKLFLVRRINIIDQLR